MQRNDSPARNNRVPIMLSDEELQQIDDWRFANKVATRSAAIRRLAQMAVDSSKTRTPRIKTSYWAKPIPTNALDWSAIDDSTYDGEGCPVGYGATEQEAIDDLLEQMEDAQ